MSGQAKTIRALTKYAESLGVHLELLSENAHRKYRLTYDGRTELLITPRSASCPFSVKKQQAFIKRFKEAK